MHPNFKDRAGKRYNKLVVLRYAETHDKHGYANWVCRCDCGHEVVATSKDLQSGDVRSCGCASALQDLTGKKFYMLTVLRRASSGHNRGATWVCRCDCGKEVIVRGDHMKTGNTKSCGCWHEIAIGKRQMKPAGMAAFNQLFWSYINNAKQRGLPFELSEERFRELVFQACQYCGQRPSKSWHGKRVNGNILYNGIDRVDNSIGYTEANSVSCCEVCNKMKLCMPLEQFLAHIQRIARLHPA